MNIILLSILYLVHPFHVSVSDIKYKEEEKAIQISTRIFLDDLEEGLKAYSNREQLDITSSDEWDFVNETLRSYLLDNVSLRDEKDKPYELNYIGAEIEDDVMWCYLEIEKVKKLKTVHYTNTILHEVFADQENLVHFRAYDEVKSARLFKGEPSKKFSWE